MATLSLTIFKAKQLADGRHKIRIAVRHHHETTYIITPYIIDNLSQFKDGRVVKRYDADIINTNLRNLLNKYQQILDELNNISSYSSKELKNIMLSYGSKDYCVLFSAVYKSYVELLRQDGRNGYAELIKRCGNYFVEFLNGDIQASSITPQMVSNFERFLKVKKWLNQTTVGMYLTRLRVIINAGVKFHSVQYEVHPFTFQKIPHPLERQLDITLNEFHKLKSYLPKTKIKQIAKDLWLLSFYLGGINLVDLLQIDFSSSENISYIRQKTANTKMGEKRIELTIPTEAKEIIIKYKNDNGRLSFDYSFTYRNFARYVARTLRNIGSEIGIKRLCYYSARKTFVQYGFELGVALEVLEYTIGQSMKQNRPIYNYIRIMRKHADEAINKIIEYTKG